MIGRNTNYIWSWVLKALEVQPKITILSSMGSGVVQFPMFFQTSFVLHSSEKVMKGSKWWFIICLWTIPLIVVILIDFSRSDLFWKTVQTDIDSFCDQTVLCLLTLELTLSFRKVTRPSSFGLSLTCWQQRDTCEDGSRPSEALVILTR